MGDDINTLQRTRDYYKKYCNYEGLLSPQNVNDPQNNCQTDQQIIMLPYRQQNKTISGQAFMKLGYKTIGQQINSKVKLGQKNTQSRQNMHQIHKKLKQLRQNRYNEGKEQNNQYTTQSNFRLTGRSKIFTLLKQQNSPLVFKSSSANFNTRKHIKRSSSKDKILQNSFVKQKPVKSQRNGLRSPSSLTKIMPNQFKTKMKVKCVQDNPKYLATLIRKKVQFMNRQEVYDYIQKLVGKSNKHS